MKQQAVNGIDPFLAIGDPNRRQMLHLLSRESMTINTLAGNFDITRPAVSKHVKILYGAGFISIHNIGRERHCALNQKGFRELQSWIDYFDQFWQVKMKKLDELINGQNKKTKKANL
jgi:DNA-binding transcriptional ArsR family regulator